MLSPRTPFLDAEACDAPFAHFLWLQLPDALIEKIISLLQHYKDYLCVSLTCKSWNKCLPRVVDLSHHPQLTNTQLDCVAKQLKIKATAKVQKGQGGNQIHSVILCGCRSISAKGLSSLHDLPIVFLNLDKCRLNKKCITELKKFPHLNHLILSRFFVDSCLNPYAKPKHLLENLNNHVHIEYAARRKKTSLHIAKGS
jgi:hypothetical protein